MSAYKTKQATTKVSQKSDNRPQFIHSDTKNSLTAGQLMLERVQKTKKQRAGGIGLSVVYDASSGKYTKQNDSELDIQQEQEAIFQKQIQSTQDDLSQNRKVYTENVAMALLDELNTEYQRAQLLDDLFSTEEKTRLKESFALERQQLLQYVKSTRTDFDEFQAVKGSQLVTLLDGASLKVREQQKEEKQKAIKLQQLEQQMIVELKKKKEEEAIRLQVRKDIQQKVYGK
ncbi:Hypothetical_protein [Hexamita inflata]|uniref:Hypothetical_protein n=1 Tax=Hexamita inflata TaxID=28002 RepID=A0ABP1KSX4_9EUKA